MTQNVCERRRTAASSRGKERGDPLTRLLLGCLPTGLEQLNLGAVTGTAESLLRDHTICTYNIPLLHVVVGNAPFLLKSLPAHLALVRARPIRRSPAPLATLRVTGPCFARVRRFRWRVFLVRQFPSSLSNNACGLRSSSVAPFGRCPLIFLSKYCTDVIRSARDLISKLNHLDTSRSPRCSLSLSLALMAFSLSHPGRPILCVRHSTPANQPVHIPSSRLRTLTPN